MAINLACTMVQNAGRLWAEMTVPDHRQRLQKALFPDGLEYLPDSGFGTAENTYPVRVLQEFSADESRMAPHLYHGSNSLLVWLKRVHVFYGCVHTA